MQAVIKVQNINKTYDSVTALKDISFEVEKGELFGLIGPDGSGKTTLFRILSTLLLPDSGEAFIHDLNIAKNYRKIRSIVGYMPGRFSLYHDLTVEENLRFYATIYGTTINENYHLIEDIYKQIEPFKNRRAGKLSGGMKQKLALSCALIHNPDILFLDEPTTGVDAVSRKEFWDMLKKLVKLDITILVSTPYMDEAELCDRVALLQDGQIMTINNPIEITREFSRPIYKLKSDDNYGLLKDLRKMPKIRSVFAFGDFIHLVSEEKIEINKMEEQLKLAGHRSLFISETVADIEDCFMDLMWKEKK